MLWDEVYLDRTPKNEELTLALSSSLGVAQDRIRIVHDLERAPNGARVLVELTGGGGDFTARCGIYPLATPSVGRDAFAKQIARDLACRVLTSSADTNPYLAVLVHPDGRTENVALDVAALDQNDVVIVGPATGTGPEEAPRRAHRLRDVSTNGRRADLQRATVATRRGNVYAHIRELIDLYLEAPLTVMQGTPEQERAFEALSAAVVALPTDRAPLDPLARNAVVCAADRVRAIWPPEDVEPGTSLGALLAVADLIR
jgi:hypothetical protein